MTKQFADILLTDIKVGDRAREDLGDIEALQNSIKNRGLMNPIMVSKESMELVAGYRRLICHRNLGLRTILAQYYEELSEIEKKIFELEENLHKELTWNERANLRSRIHELWQEERGKAIKGYKGRGQSLEDSAESLGVSITTLSQDITLAEAMKLVPKIAEFTSRKQALKSLGKMKEVAILTELARRDVEEHVGVGGEKLPYVISCGDALKLTDKTIEPETIDLVLFDPGWGISSDKKASERGPRGEKVFYDDSPEVSFKFMLEMLPRIYEVMKNDTHMYMFVGIQYVSYWISILTNQRLILKDGIPHKYETVEKDRNWKFDVRSIPLIWVKEGGGFTDFEYKFMPRYESILFCQKGKRVLNYPTSDVSEKARPLTTERIHPQQKSIELLKEYIKLSTHPNEIVFDPTFGSGASIVASILTGRQSVGFEKDKEAFLKAEDWIKGIKVESDE